MSGNKYNAHAVQDEIATIWDNENAFHASPQDPGDPYAIVIPPPNVTAALHLGHALNNTLQDILIRYHRMLGDNTMWMPGSDHAGIATQTVVDKRLKAQGEPALAEYKQIERDGGNGREQFLKKVYAWKDEFEAKITHQLKEMGCSCDWERQRFTMDEVCAASVREAFYQLFKEGLIYRGKRLVNWDPATQTALADDEVEMKDVDGFFWYMKYPVIDENDQPTGEHATVATTRPETMLGDTAVAVNPRDEKNAHLIGKRVKLPIVNRIIPIVGDDYVVIGNPESDDPKAKYASGFLKVTPAHDQNDWEIGIRHEQTISQTTGGFVRINVMAPDASISKDHGWDDFDKTQPDPFINQLLGQDRYEARKRIVQWFKDNNFLADIKDYNHTVGHSYRSHVPVEPYLSDQWYVRVTDDRLAGAALRAMNTNQRSQTEGPVWKNTDSFTVADESKSIPTGDWEGGLTFYPPRYAKTFQTWHENIRDWCISRQLWWGHQIPVWSHFEFNGNEKLESQLNTWKADGRLSLISTDCEMHVCIRDDNETEIIDLIEAAGFTRDPDVLDTWFSSALWPISTLGWPNPEAFNEILSDGLAALEKWNPSSTLCTAREIITLWVSRMVMFNLFFRKCLPFKDVFIHAMIQDGEGQKMSKSLGNGVDPLDIIHSHGADAMRFTMAWMTTSTQDVRMPVDLICPYTDKTFSPKMITNAAGYRVMAPVQHCPDDPKKQMVTVYGVVTAEAEATKEMPLARNSSSKFDEGRNFANKLWNVVTGFALRNLEDRDSELSSTESLQLNLADRWILSRLARTIATADKALANFEFKPYGDALYDFIWRDFCDWYVEAVKPIIKEDSPAGSAARKTLATCVDAMLRLLHPVMPFVTEKLYQKLNDVAPNRTAVQGINLQPNKLCVNAKWPQYENDLISDTTEQDFDTLNNLIKAIRTVRNQLKVPQRDTVNIHVKAGTDDQRLLNDNNLMLQTLAACQVVAISENLTKPDGTSTTIVGEIEVYIEVEADDSAERERLTLRQAELAKSKGALQGRLNNKGYTDKAPPHLVEETRKQLADVEAELQAVETTLAELG